MAPVAAKAASVSRSGIGEARPEVRVSTSDWATPGSVNSRFSAAAAAAKAGTPGVIVYATPAQLEAAKLLAHGAEDREVARVEPGDVLAPCGRLDAELDDRVEIERRRIDDSRARRAMIKQRGGHERAGVKADGRTRDEIAPA